MLDDNTIAGRITGVFHDAQPSYALTIAYHPNINHIGATHLISLTHDAHLEVSRLQPTFTVPGNGNVGPLADRYISRKPFTFTVTSDGVLITPNREGSKLAVDGKPLEQTLRLNAIELEQGVVINIAGRVLMVLHAQNEPLTVLDEMGMVGISDSLQRAKQAMHKVADMDISVLIRGETGSGKELVAQGIHWLSNRSKESLVSVNVGAIPQSLAIAELFGARKGAYTGATKDKPGFFQQADGGTLFLDEIGDASEEVQVALLRTLETGQLTPVGGTEPVSVDVRVIAATDAEIEQKIGEATFRRPLLQRLAGFEVWLPPLRRRRVDIALLFAHFLKHECETHSDTDYLEIADDRKVSFWRKMFQSSLAYDWPGNIRELKNVVTQLVVHNRGQKELSVPLHLESLLLQRRPTDRPAHSASEQTSQDEDGLRSEGFAEPSLPRRKPREIGVQELLAVLEEQRYDLKKTADALRISRAALYKMIEKTPEVKKAGDLTAEELKAAYAECEGDLERMVDRLKVSRSALKRRVNEME